jgi:hypothetical protein
MGPQNLLICLQRGLELLGDLADPAKESLKILMSLGLRDNS